MAWTQTDIDELKAQVATLQQKVQYADKGVTYQPLQDALALLKVMEASVADGSTSTTSSGRFTRASFSRE